MKFDLTYPAEIGSRCRELGMTRHDLARISRVDYVKIRHLEHGRYRKIEAPILEALCYALSLHPTALSADYEPRPIPAVTYAAIDGRMVAEYLEREGISANELAHRAGVDHNRVYAVVYYDQQTVPADVARKLAKAMGMRGYELAPALGIWPGPDGEEMMSELVGEYGGQTPGDVTPLPQAEDSEPPEIS